MNENEVELGNGELKRVEPEDNEDEMSMEGAE